VDASPSGMVRVPAGSYKMGSREPVALPAYWLDRYEVTNQQFKRFVDAGGYRKPEHWKEPLFGAGHSISWEAALGRFRDRTGQPGPAAWEGGAYPEGQADDPVRGVSWYEAAAYADFAGKSLPTIYHWLRAARAGGLVDIVRLSNFGGEGPLRVGRSQGLGPFGTYDMAGNVREWTKNALDLDQHFILSGSWRSPTYLYADPESLPAFDRSPENGIRCVRNLGPLPRQAEQTVRTLRRDFAKFRPASDEVFRAYRAMYAYDHSPLEPRDEGVVEDTPDWRTEKVTFDTAYGNERMAAFLFLPKRVRPPYQTVLFFPSARVTWLKKSDHLGDVSFFDYVVQSGRAVIYPIYQETYERRVRNIMPSASQDRALTVERYQDVARSLDYLATRRDIALDKLAYLGVSMGSAEGVIYATLAQDRLKAVVFLDGGYFLDRPPAGADQADFAPRLKIPVLMVNGRYDFTFSLEYAQLPLFRMLGTPPADKRHVVLETPHDVRLDRPRLVKEVLAWLDKYLGRVE